MDSVYLQNMLDCPQCEKKGGMMAHGGRGYEDDKIPKVEHRVGEIRREQQCNTDGMMG